MSFLSNLEETAKADAIKAAKAAATSAEESAKALAPQVEQALSNETGKVIKAEMGKFTPALLSLVKTICEQKAQLEQQLGALQVQLDAANLKKTQLVQTLSSASASLAQHAQASSTDVAALVKAAGVKLG